MDGYIPIPKLSQCNNINLFFIMHKTLIQFSVIHKWNIALSLAHLPSQLHVYLYKILFKIDSGAGR